MSKAELICHFVQTSDEDGKRTFVALVGRTRLVLLPYKRHRIRDPHWSLFAEELPQTQIEADRRRRRKLLIDLMG